MKDLTPKDKAKELVQQFTELGLYIDTAKQCALIAVQNIICANPHSNPFNTDMHSTMGWWQEVKSEIEQL